MVIVESILTAFVIAFIALCAFGHVLLFAALWRVISTRTAQPRPPGSTQIGARNQLMPHRG